MDPILLARMARRAAPAVRVGCTRAQTETAQLPVALVVREESIGTEIVTTTTTLDRILLPHLLLRAEACVNRRVR